MFLSAEGFARMSLAAVLEKARPALASRWVDAANAAYPFATAGFLRTRLDPFANPVGQRSRDLSDILFSAVIGKAHDGKVLRACLEEFVRVRAVQDMPVETALQVMFAYKGIIREYIKEHTMELDEAKRNELEAMDDRCDTLALLSFGIFVRARETFFEAKVSDVRRRGALVMRLARRHGLAVPDETEPEEPGEDAPGEPGRDNKTL